jgi:hypothetical protein
VIGLLADELGNDARLAGWDPLDAADVGERRVAYRYRLVTDTTELGGEATIVVFARGEEVGLSGTAALGARTPIDALAMARLMDPEAVNDRVQPAPLRAGGFYSFPVTIR